jgi:hypothetical protein
MSVMDNRDMVDWNLEIGRVVIEGIELTAYQRTQLKETLEAELGRMFASGAPDGIRSVSGNLKGEAIRLDGSKPAPVELGKQIAATVFKSLSGGK